MLSNESILILNTLIYLTTLFFYLKKMKSITIGSLLLMLYSLISITAYFLFIDPHSNRFFTQLNLFSFVYLFFVLILIALPILKFNPNKINSLVLPESFFLKFLSIFIILIFFINSFNVFSSINAIFSSRFLDFSLANDIYNSTRDQINEPGINIIGVIVTAFRDWPIFLIFYHLANKRKNKFLIWGLFFSIITMVLSALSNGLRSYVVFLFMEIVFLFHIFKNYYTRPITKLLKRTILMAIIIISIPFIIITIGRFSTGYSSALNPRYATKAYLGQSFLYFNNYGLDANGIRNGDRIAPLFKKLLGLEAIEDPETRKIRYSNMKVNDSVFITYVGDFTLDFGPYLSFLFFILIFLFFNKNLRIGKNLYLHQIFLMYFLWNICTHGIFLFSFANIGGNLKIILNLLIFYILKINSNTSKVYYIPPTSNT